MAAILLHAATLSGFPDRLLGQQVTEPQRLARVRDLLRWWYQRDPPFYETLEVAAGALRRALEGLPILLVLDDVWQASDLAPFSGIGSPAALLITTRNTHALVLPVSARTITVDALQVSQAIDLLGQGLDSTLHLTGLSRLARRLGEWPILLKLVNAQLREECRYGASVDMALNLVESSLDELGLTAFDREDDEARDLAVRKTVEASLKRLSIQERLQYGRLAVFPEDEQIPIPVVELLWRTQEQETTRLCSRLAEMSLLYRFDLVGRKIQLHDVMRAYLLQEHRQDVESFHGSLVDNYASLINKPIQEAAEHYFTARLPYHLKAGRRERDLEDLLFSYGWLETKLARAGVNAAIADYELLPKNEETALISDALRLSRAILSRDPSQLPSHLHGRLAGYSLPRLTNLLEGASDQHGRLWLRPLTASFRHPHGPLVASFEAHQSEILAIVQLDDNRFATAGKDGEIRVWDFSSGEKLLSIPVPGGSVQHLAVTESGLVLSASDDGVIRLWDLNKELVTRTYIGHSTPITALHLRRSEFFSGSEDGVLLRWSLDAEESICSLQGHTARINGVGYLDSRTIVSIAADGTLRVWNVPSCKTTRRVEIPGFPAEALEVTQRVSPRLCRGTPSV